VRLVETQARRRGPLFRKRICSFILGMLSIIFVGFDANNGITMYRRSAVNRFLTVRNWLIGFYIVEFEQNGEDRAKYGVRLIRNLAKAVNRPGLSFSNLKTFKQFYITYRRLGFKAFETLNTLQIGQTSGQLQLTENQLFEIEQMSARSYETDPDLLLNRLSFSHITLIMQFDDPVTRAFYEIESIKGGWGVKHETVVRFALGSFRLPWSSPSPRSMPCRRALVFCIAVRLSLKLNDFTLNLAPPLLLARTPTTAQCWVSSHAGAIWEIYPAVEGQRKLWSYIFRLAWCSPAERMVFTFPMLDAPPPHYSVLAIARRRRRIPTRRNKYHLIGS
jgi:hypothetical protein